MPSKHSMCRAYLFSLIAMAVMPAALLVYVWLADLHGNFAAQYRNQILLAALMLFILAIVIALRLTHCMRLALQDFAALFASANANSTVIDLARLPFIECETLALNANRMIEQRNRIESTLRTSEQRFEMALSASGSHLWDMSLTDQVVTMNGNLHQQLGYPEIGRELDAASWAAMVHPADAERVQNSLAALLKPSSKYSVEFRMRDNKGDYHWMLARGAVVEFDAVGKPVRALGTVIEITDHKRMEQELVAARIAAEDANHAKSQFLSSISHELRTPLNGVLGYAQILLRDQNISAEHHHNLSAIESCGQHLLTLINDVLDLAKIESGKIDIDEQSCDLYDLLQSVGNIVRERITNKGLDYRLDIGASVPPVIRVDAVKLRQILVNLLGNAIKFTPRGTVELRVLVQHDSELLFQVADTGIGIPSEKQRDIFSPFYQIAGTAGGTGLGLPISQRLCEAMGGQLTVQSTFGAGSCFSFSLPLKANTSASMLPPQHATHQLIDTAERTTTVMVVDDNRVNRQVLVGMLRASGIAVVQAESGRDALDQLRARPLPLVLMDVRMPVMDGFEATRAIKSDPQLRDTIVVAISASVSADVIEGMRAQGCDNFIAKPVRIGELLAVIAQYLQLPLRAIEQPAAMASLSAAQLPESLLKDLRAAVAVGDIESLRNALRPLHDEPHLVAWATHIEHQLDYFDIEAVRNLLAVNDATLW